MERTSFSDKRLCYNKFLFLTQEIEREVLALINNSSNKISELQYLDPFVAEQLLREEIANTYIELGKLQQRLLAYSQQYIDEMK